MLKSIKGKTLAAVIAVVLVMMVYTVVGNIIDSKPIKSGTNIITGEVMDFEKNKNAFDEAFVVLLDYASEVKAMPETKERKSFVAEVDRAIFAVTDGHDSGVISTGEWNELNDKFQNIRDEYEIETAQQGLETYKSKYE